MPMTAFEFFDYAGTFAFAISGALAAMNKKFDPLGVFILAAVTAVGGGSLRDMLIGRTPVGWMQDMNYLYLIIAATVVAILFRSRLSYFRRTFFLFDSIGLAIFTIVGVELGLQHQLHPIICVILGTMTASFGGLIRDILCNQVPVILHQEIYASASLGGALLYLAFQQSHLQQSIIYLLISLFIVGIRIMAVKFHWHLPKFYKEV